jgi:hypothetical protein
MFVSPERNEGESEKGKREVMLKKCSGRKAGDNLRWMILDAQTTNAAGEPSGRRHAANFAKRHALEVTKGKFGGKPQQSWALIQVSV